MSKSRSKRCGPADPNRPPKIHVAWPVLCKAELDDIINKLNGILKRVSWPGDKGDLILAVRSAIVSGKKALDELEQAYGE